VRKYPYMLAAGVLMVLLFATQELVEDRGSDALRWAALPLGAVALFLAFAPMATFRRHGRVEPGGTYMDATRVIEEGLFRLVRHPQYLGYIFLNLTFMVASQHWIPLVLGGGSILLFYIHAVKEEKGLLAKFGEDYGRYMERVPRFNFVSGAVRAVRGRRHDPGGE
jgi:protein-S-isoprenylcysteine O-methyltransferase Ste14